MYIAVYGYSTGGHFTLTASSLGVLTLQAGRSIAGAVGQAGVRYYRFRNSDEVAVISLTLSTNYGDADLYVNTVKSGAALVFPNPSDWASYQWSSRSTFSNDTVSIRYDDTSDRFCFNCDYIVAVYGYRNSSYTLSYVSGEDAVIHLLPNKALKLSMQAMQLRYTAYQVAGSSENLLVSLTSLDTGSADLFVMLWDLEQALGMRQEDLLPDPLIPASYTYTTAGSEDDLVHLPGPFVNETLVVITIRANTDIAFNILVSSSSSPVILQPG